MEQNSIKIIIEVPAEIDEIITNMQEALRDQVYLKEGIEPREENRHKVPGTKKISKAVILQMLIEKLKRGMRFEVGQVVKENQKLLNKIQNQKLEQ